MHSMKAEAGADLGRSYGAETLTMFFYKQKAPLELEGICLIRGDNHVELLVKIIHIINTFYRRKQ